MPPLLPLVLLLFSSNPFELAGEVYSVPRHDYRVVDLGNTPEAAVIEAAYQVRSGPPVRMQLMRRADADRMNRGESANAVMSTALAQQGKFQVRLSDPNNYSVIVDNRANDTGAAQVFLHVSIDYGATDGPGVRHLSRERQLVVVGLSFFVFFGIVTFSARKLWKVTQGRPPHQL